MRVRAPAFILVAILGLVSNAITAMAEEADTFYLASDDVPRATLSTRIPVHGDLPNYDPGRDIAPGLRIERSHLGMQEEDEARYQQWQTDLAGYSLSGVPVLVLWAAVAGFDTAKTGTYTAYLLDCDEWGYGCKAFAAQEHTFRAELGETWVETMVRFDDVDYGIDEGRTLGVRIVASEESEGDLLLAYDRLSFRSRLMFTTAALAPAPKAAEVLATPNLEGFPENEEEVFVDRVAAESKAVAFAETTESASPGKWLALFAASTVFLGSLASYVHRRLGAPRDRIDAADRRRRPTMLSG